jgi:hypothetical protein
LADYSITAANVVAGSGAKKVSAYNAGATITAGQAVYLDSSTSTLKLADNDSATAAVRSPVGIALHAALSGQPLTYCASGPLTLGASLAVGDVVCLSSTAGGLCPSADIAAGDYNTIMGIATSTTVLDVKIHEAGAVKV